MKVNKRVIKDAIVFIYLKLSYFIARYKINRYSRNHKIKVLFLISEVAKWKAQSLYDSLSKDTRFEPIICLYPMQVQMNDNPISVKKVQEEKMMFFVNKNMKVLDIWDADTRQLNNEVFNEPSIVFYQQTWDQPPAPDPICIASRHLTFYIPYYLINNYHKELDLDMKLQRRVYRYVLQNQQIVDFFYSQVKKSHFAGKLVGLGHPCTDGYSMPRENVDYSVIYAPHFSFYVEEIGLRWCNYSTFLSNGELILEYAKSHPFIKWVFKPHPRLKMELINTGVWTKEKVEAYYKSWEDIGQVCLTSDYKELFINSDLMITDCGSFLSEYSCTGKPLIRMISPYLALEPHPILRELYNTFYVARNNSELVSYMNMLIEQRKDPQKKNREKEVDKIGFCTTNVANRIHDYLSQYLAV